MPHEDIVILGGNHSMITAPKVSGVKFDKEAFRRICQNEENKKSARINPEHFGLFDSSSPNYTTYYPEVSDKDLKPEDSEFIEPVFRMLSKTIVHANWNPIDFGYKSALKDSMNLLIGQTINVDHETPVGNAIGSVKSVFWQNSYKTEAGLIVPAGINGVFKIDGKSNPRLARGIMMDPPSIHSNSVTVAFQWEQSHPNMAVDEFWSKLGTFDENGEMIRRLAVKVKAYYETSLVSHGADPFAKKMDDKGKIIMPQHVASVTSFSDNPKTNNYFVIDYKTREGIISNSKAGKKPNTIPIVHNNNNPKENNNDMKDTLTKLAVALALNNFTGESVEEFVAAVQAKEDASKAELQGKVTDLTTKLNDATTKQGDLEKEVSTLKAQVEEASKTELAEVKAECLTQLGKLYAGDENKAKLESFKKVVDNLTDVEAATVLLEGYNTELEEKFPMSCSKCGSAELTRNSHKNENPDPIAKPRGRGEIREGFKSRQRNEG